MRAHFGLVAIVTAGLWVLSTITAEAVEGLRYPVDHSQLKDYGWFAVAVVVMFGTVSAATTAVQNHRLPGAKIR